MMDMELGFYLKQEHYEMMLEDVIKQAPIESCGMVAGRNGYSEKIYSITNILNSPIRFRMLPEEQLFAFNDIEDCGLELIAIYHSHPKGPHKPSATDISEFYYPGTISLIWSPQKNNWVCHGFRIDGDKVSEVLVKILEKE
jgi:proteasome lid subunit RPN8/RPN11